MEISLVYFGFGFIFNIWLESCKSDKLVFVYILVIDLRSVSKRFNVNSGTIGVSWRSK